MPACVYTHQVSTDAQGGQKPNLSPLKKQQVLTTTDPWRVFILGVALSMPLHFAKLNLQTLCLWYRRSSHGSVLSLLAAFPGFFLVHMLVTD